MLVTFTRKPSNTQVRCFLNIKTKYWYITTSDTKL